MPGQPAGNLQFLQHCAAFVASLHPDNYHFTHAGFHLLVHDLHAQVSRLWKCGHDRQKVTKAKEKSQNRSSEKQRHKTGSDHRLIPLTGSGLEAETKEAVRWLLAGSVHAECDCLLQLSPPTRSKPKQAAGKMWSSISVAFICLIKSSF